MCLLQGAEDGEGMSLQFLWQEVGLPALLPPNGGQILDILETEFKRAPRDFPGGPVVENLSCNAGDAGSIPGRGTKIPYDTRQLSPHATTREPMHSGPHVPQLQSPRALEPARHN